MAEIYRQKSFHTLAKQQQNEKLKKDSEYEIATQNISASFYTKKRSAGVTAQEESNFNIASDKLWNDYYEWAKGFGLYEVISVDKQLAEAELSLAKNIEQVNLLRSELKKPLVEVKEK